ncbi:MAG: DUF2798 domain-containing protein [Spirochaetaceae bacterium]|jgi:drug/metabolite transporter (DMT)-like permease|nr:DUF2798 domain-containing protein [Spirochaetaceae bacterium]
MSFGQIVFNGFWMALIMSVCMAFVMTVVNVGFGDNFIRAWLTGAGVGFIVSLPLSFFLPPLLQKIMKMLNI